MRATININEKKNKENTNLSFLIGTFTTHIGIPSQFRTTHDGIGIAKKIVRNERFFTGSSKNTRWITGCFFTSGSKNTRWNTGRCCFDPSTRSVAKNVIT